MESMTILDLPKLSMEWATDSNISCFSNLVDGNLEEVNRATISSLFCFHEFTKANVAEEKRVRWCRNLLKENSVPIVLLFSRHTDNPTEHNLSTGVGQNLFIKSLETMNANAVFSTNVIFPSEAVVDSEIKFMRYTSL